MEEVIREYEEVDDIDPSIVTEFKIIQVVTKGRWGYEENFYSEISIKGEKGWEITTDGFESLSELEREAEKEAERLKEHFVIETGREL